MRQQHILSQIVFSLSLGFILISCGESEPNNSPYNEELAAEVIANYAEIVHSSYVDAQNRTILLQGSIDKFLASPDGPSLEAAKAAWLSARDPYGQTEVYRFYGGPIDVEPNGPEGLINAWPLDEAYIDYVEGDENAGIINNPTDYPELNETVLMEANGDGGEENVATGYHAIEFLLWGQDMSADGPGARPYTDFVTDGSGTAQHQDRRQTYLHVSTDLLVKNLEQLVEAWQPDSENYRKAFSQLPTEETLTHILLGMGSLSGAELAGERITVAFDTQDQEDEHSCFSDNTHQDLLNNQLGIQNVYLGRYGQISGKGLTDLVASLDAELDQKMRMQLEAAVAAIQAIPAPFDRAIVEHREQVSTAIEALRAQTKTIAEIADLLGLSLNLEE